MKLRMTAGSIRLRLSQTDVRNFVENGAVEEEVRFGASGKQRLAYRLERSQDVSVLTANFVNNSVTVAVPHAMADDWAGTDRVGISNDGTGSPVTVLVEKDFTCLVPRIGENDKDTFPHPGAVPN
jgi:hypothetical protein